MSESYTTNGNDATFRAWIDRDVGRRIAQELGITALAVYWELACYRPTVRPSMLTMAANLGISRATIKRTIHALEASGFLASTATPGEPSTYLLADQEVGSPMTPPPNEVGSRVTQGSGHRCAGGRVTHDPGVGSPVTPKGRQLRRQLRKTNKKSAARARFVRPTADEISSFCASQGITIDVARFLDHYESNGWRIGGKSPMKSWQAAVRNWHRNDLERSKSNGRPRADRTGPGQRFQPGGKVGEGF